jgi:hypothetical protein
MKVFKIKAFFYIIDFLLESSIESCIVLILKKLQLNTPKNTHNN